MRAFIADGQEAVAGLDVGKGCGHSDEKPFAIGEVKVYRPPHISPQIAPQQAAFTVHPNPQEVFDSEDLVRWTLEIKGTLDMKLALDAVGISRASLFPGADGLASALNWKYKWDALRY